MKALVSTDWLAAELGKRDLVVLDCSWFMPSSGRSGYEEYREAHIQGAGFLDLDALSDHSHASPHMLPPAPLFAEAMGRMGVSEVDRIVVYDNSPLRTAARGWFMLRHFGATQVAILDGGLQKWLAEGRPTDREATERAPTKFRPVERNDVVTKDQLLGGLGTPLVDARGKARFEGSEPDPRPGVDPGHAPGAVNIPFATLYNDDGTFRGTEEIRHIFEAAGIDPSRPLIATCGSGVTANSLIFAAHLLGHDTGRLYDGSWSEWGADPQTAKVLGPA